MRLPRLAWRSTRAATRSAVHTTVRLGTAGTRLAAGALVRRAIKLPPVEAVPQGRMV